MASIRILDRLEYFIASEALQKEVWGFADREIFPGTDLWALVPHGAIGIGAFNGGRMVGFSYSSPGLDDRGPYHYSWLTGVSSAVRDTGLGFRLKLAQRAACREQGIDRIVWTFDPLQSRNAFFNLEKLGAVIRRYKVNFYGEGTTNRFAGGLPTDRLVPEWRLKHPDTVAHLAGRMTPVPIEEVTTGDHWVRLVDAPGDPRGGPRRRRVPPGARRLAIEVPRSIDTLLLRDPARARDWRLAVRRAFLEAFAAGYAAKRFATGETPAGRRSFYLLTRRTG